MKQRLVYQSKDIVHRRRRQLVNTYLWLGYSLAVRIMNVSAETWFSSVPVCAVHEPKVLFTLCLRMPVSPLSGEESKVPFTLSLPDCVPICAVQKLKDPLRHVCGCLCPHCSVARLV